MVTEIIITINMVRSAIIIGTSASLVFFRFMEIIFRYKQRNAKPNENKYQKRNDIVWKVKGERISLEGNKKQERKKYDQQVKYN